MQYITIFLKNHAENCKKWRRVDIRTVFVSGTDAEADTPGYPRIPTGYPPKTVADTPRIPLTLPNVSILNTASFFALVDFYLFTD